MTPGEVLRLRAIRTAEPPQRRRGINARFLLAVAALFAGAWLASRLEYTAGSDFGYALGIAGGGAMLLLLLYPVRKRTRFMQHWLPMAWWFRAHMALGVIGPALIVLHSRLGFGSINGAIAFGSMTVVFLSGLIGRLVYTRIHHGLYGRRKTLPELREALERVTAALPARGPIGPEVFGPLLALEREVLTATAARPTLGSRLRLALRVWRVRQRVRREVMRALSKRLAQGAARRQALLGVDACLDAIGEVARFELYQKLFSYWHVLHIPLLVLLLLTGTVHVLAVHMY